MSRAIDAGATDDADSPTYREVARSDLRACADAGLHWIVGVIFVGLFGAVGATMALVSEAVYTTGDLAGTIELVTTNAAWLVTSLFALVGLFVGWPAFGDGTPGGRAAILGRLCSRWLLVAAGVGAGLVTLLVVAVVAYDPFSPVAFAAFALATVALALAYTSLGVAVSTVVATPGRAVGWLVAIYATLVVLWESWIIPLGLLLVVSGGSSDVLVARPDWFDALVAASPGGAYAVLGDGIVAGSVETLEGYALGVALAWLVLPPAIAIVISDRR